jgi:hypothetical protein
LKSTAKIPAARRRFEPTETKKSLIRDGFLFKEIFGLVGFYNPVTRESEPMITFSFKILWISAFRYVV